MIGRAVELVMKQVRSNLAARGSDIELLSVTEPGIVRVSLSGECCSGRLMRLLTVLDIEETVQKSVPGVKIVIEDSDLATCRNNCRESISLPDH